MFLVIFLVVVAVAIGLMLLYHVGRKNKRVGASVGFGLLVLCRIPVKLEDALYRAARYFHGACLASLAFPPGVSGGDCWPGIAVLSHVVLFILALCILPGESANVVLLMPTIFHTERHVNLPGIAEYATASLLVCVPALFGSVCLECIGLIPHGAGLFGKMRTLTRWIVGLISFVILILSVFVTSMTYVFRAAYLDSPDLTQGMNYYILGGLGLSVAVSTMLALWALVVGGISLVSLLLWIAEHVCKVVATLVSFIPAPINDITIHLAGVSVYQDFGKPDECPVPSIQFEGAVPALPRYSATALLPQNTSVVDSSSDLETEEVVPAQTLTEVQMSKPKPENGAIVLLGGLGTQMLSPIAQKIAELRATGSIRSWYHLDLSVNQVNTTIDGIVDLSPTHAERQAVLMHEETEDQANRKLLNNLVDKIVTEHLDAKVYPDTLIFVIDSRQLVSCVKMLESISHRLPRHSLVVVTELSSIDAKLLSVQTGLKAMESLHAKEFLETTIVTDPKSAFATQFGLDSQHRFLAHTLLGLVLSHKHSSSNPSFVNVLHSLHNLSPYTALNIASENVVIGSLPKGLGFANLFGLKGQAGAGNQSDILAQTRSAIDRCFTQEDSRTFPSLVTPESACTILLSVPIRLDDKRFPACVRDNALYVSSHYPHATCATVRGNGTAHHNHIGSRFLVQASCLYPLQPQLLLSSLSDKGTVKVTSLHPLTTAIEPVSSNGTASAKDQKPVVKKTKAASTSRQTNPASRGGRKSNKQAQ